MSTLKEGQIMAKGGGERQGGEGGEEANEVRISCAWPAAAASERAMQVVEH